MVTIASINGSNSYPSSLSFSIASSLMLLHQCTKSTVEANCSVMSVLS